MRPPCFCQPMFSSPYVSVRLRLCQSASMSACTLASLHPQHCSAPSLISPIFIHLSGSVCSSRLSCSFLFSLILSFHSSFSLFLFFSFSLIFSLPILLTLLVPTATHLFLSKTLYREHTLRNCDVPHAPTHPFRLKTLYREQIPGHWAAFPSATRLFLSKYLYREHTLRNIDVPLAATHPFELKTLCRKRERGGCRP